LESAVPIITTLQKFPFLEKQLKKLADKREEKDTLSRQTRRRPAW
jgi:hypothetical protein